MMGALREWIASVVMVTMLLSVSQNLIPEGSIKKIASFTGGLILLVALLQPVLGADLKRLDLHLKDYGTEIEMLQQELAEAGETQMQAIIAERTAAYISDKADTLGLKIMVTVDTMEQGENDLPVPESVKIRGPWSEELAVYMENELGIPRERQDWNEVEN